MKNRNPVPFHVTIDIEELVEQISMLSDIQVDRFLTQLFQEFYKGLSEDEKIYYLQNTMPRYLSAAVLEDLFLIVDGVRK